MKEQLKKLRDENKRLQKEVAGLQDTIIALTKLVAELERIPLVTQPFVPQWQPWPPWFDPKAKPPVWMGPDTGGTNDPFAGCAKMTASEREHGNFIWHEQFANQSGQSGDFPRPAACGGGAN